MPSIVPRYLFQGRERSAQLYGFKILEFILLNLKKEKAWIKLGYETSFKNLTIEVSKKKDPVNEYRVY
jgi:hypothetical protein